MRVTGIRETTTLKRNTNHVLSYRSSSSDGPKSFVLLRLRRSALCTLHSELPSRPYLPDGRGNSSLRSGAWSGVRRSRCCGSRSDVRSGPRSGACFGVHNVLRSGLCAEARNSICFGRRSRPLTGSRTSLRSGGRNRLRTSACSGLRNSDRYGHRNGPRSDPCSGPTSSPRSGLCPAEC